MHLQGLTSLQGLEQLTGLTSIRLELFSGVRPPPNPTTCDRVTRLVRKQDVQALQWGIAATLSGLPCACA